MCLQTLGQGRGSSGGMLQDYMSPHMSQPGGHAPCEALGKRCIREATSPSESEPGATPPIVRVGTVKPLGGRAAPA
jgi:hypothetical protein